MVLGVYPLATDKEKNAVVPVWICFLERKTKGSEYVEKLYVPINAITGEEFYDMEELSRPLVWIIFVREFSQTKK